jgi:branched-chain amino acid transport system permease protein
MNQLLAACLTVLIVMIISMGIYGAAFYPLRNTKNVLITIMVTIGVGYIISGIAQITWGTSARLLKPFSAGQPLRIGSAVITTQDLWILGTTAAVIIAFFYLFDKTYFGTTIRACMSNREAAKLMGIPTDRMGMIAFVLSGGVAALAGIVFAPATYAEYDMGMMFTLKGFVAAVLGGLTGAPAAIVGGFTLGLLESFGAGYISSGYKDFISFLALIIILILLPNGILGKKTIKKV